MIQRSYHTRDRVPFEVCEAVAPDVEVVASLQRVAMGEREDYFVRTLQEFDAHEEEIRAGLQALLAQDNSLLLLAELEGVLVGVLDFHGGDLERTRHVGHFGLTVQRDMRNRGIGSALVETLLLWARDHPVLEKVCVSLFTNNIRAINLYTRFGFKTEGRRHREYRMEPGRFLDAILLAKWIK